MKHTNIYIIGAPEGEEREEGMENLFQEMMAKKFSDLAKNTDIQVQEAEKVPNNMNPKRPTRRCHN